MTAQTVFDLAMVLIDEVPINGVFDEDRTADYLAKAPYLLTMLQNELIKDSSYYKTETIVVTTATTTDNGYVPHTMPSDFKDVYQIISEEGNYENAYDFKWEGNNILYIPDTFVGTYKIVYYPIPDAITAMTDTLVLDDTTCMTALANGLASQFILTENPDLASFLNQRYEELKYKKRKPASISNRIDIYDCTFGGN